MRNKLACLGIAFLLSGCGGSGEGGGGAGSPADRNCSDFATQEDAQAFFDQNGGSPSNNVSGLDDDRDGIACEGLPRRTAGNFFPMEVGDEWIYGDGKQIISSKADAKKIKKVIAKKDMDGTTAYRIREYLPPYTFPLDTSSPGDTIGWWSYVDGDVISWSFSPRTGKHDFPRHFLKTEVIKGDRFDLFEVIGVSEDGNDITLTNVTVNQTYRIVLSKGFGWAAECWGPVGSSDPTGPCEQEEVLLWFNCMPYKHEAPCASQ